jgi:selenocysteine-specific elongation factor
VTVVVGTAGHIDHGKTTLLHALTGIDADRLPEEKRRGLTIDVGYAHGSPDGGLEIDYVDVPGHDRLIGNMLVGVGEIDAALLVVAADDGPRAQTLEHLGLLHAMGIDRGLVAITKADLVPEWRLADVTADVADLLSATALEASPIVAVSAVSGTGLAELRSALAALRDAIEPPGVGARGGRTTSWLAIDRVFAVRGRGVVITGTSRGQPFFSGERVHIRPGDLEARVRGIEVHDVAVPAGPGHGRVALNLTGVERSLVRRGQVVTSGAAAGPVSPVSSRHLLAALAPPTPVSGRRSGEPWPPLPGSQARLHLGTDQADVVVGRNVLGASLLPNGRAVVELRLERAVATTPGGRFVLRRPRPVALLGGGVVLDTDPPRGRSRGRLQPGRVARLVSAVDAGDPHVIITALRDTHGWLRLPGGSELADDVAVASADAVIEAVRTHHLDRPDEPGLPLSTARTRGAASLRQSVSIDRATADQAAIAVVDGLLAGGRLARRADAVALQGRELPPADPARASAMERLVASLDVPAPPPLGAAAGAAGCPPDAVRELEREGRIVVVADDLAWSAAAFERLRGQALALAEEAPLTPAALRDATGTSRKYVMALLEELDRRGSLRRTAAGHVPGRRA